MTWERLGEGLASGAAAASWGREEVQLFAIRPDGQVWNRYWDGTGWHPWEEMGGSFEGQPAASARDADRIDVMAIERGGRVMHRWWDGSGWVPWEPVEGAPEDAAAVECSWVGDRLDVFVRDADGGLHYMAITE